MLTDVKTTDFMLFADPQTHGPVEDLQNDRRYHKGVDPGRDNTEGLNSDEGWVAEKEAIVPCSVYGLGGK